MNIWRISVVGAKGRLGSEIVSRLTQDGVNPTIGFGIDIKVGTEDPPYLTQSLSEGVENCDLFLTHLSRKMRKLVAEAALSRACPLLVLATGHSKEEREILNEASSQIPVAIISNASKGVFALTRLSLLAKEILGEDFDIEISEIHHSQKRDAPSGTAKSIAATLEVDFSKHEFRNGDGLRNKGSLGISSLRGGDVPGEHTVHFFGNGETLEIRHSARSRGIFASGAIQLAKNLYGRRPGLYTAEELFVHVRG